MNKIFIIGAGAWGTALAHIASYNAEKVVLYTTNKDIYDSINLNNINNRVFPENRLSHNIISSVALSDFVDYDAIVLAIPAQKIRLCINNILSITKSIDIPILICSKGIENGSNKFLSEVIHELDSNIDIAVLSGPNFASEVMQNKPTFSTIASKHQVILSKLHSTFTTRNFFIEESADIIGVQLCGSIKNVYAIAAGIAYGLELGDNFHAALIKKIIIEMQYILGQIADSSETINTYAGIGDLILTCSSMESRNARLGFAIAENQDLQSFLSKNTAEGYHTSKSIHDMFCMQEFYQNSILGFVHKVIKNQVYPIDIIELFNKK